MEKSGLAHTKEACGQSISAVKDTLYVMGGKWKLPLIIALTEGAKRFTDIQRSLDGITPKILSKELRDLELNEFVVRTVYDTVPVTITYELTEHSHSLHDVIQAMSEWGMKHKQHIRAIHRQKARVE